MITSIVLVDKYNVRVNKNGKFYAGNNVCSIGDVPFVRYRFTTYGEEEINYIKDMMTKFNKSTHLAEIKVHEGFEKEAEKIKEEIENIALFVYIPVDDIEVNCGFNDEKIALIAKADEVEFDRLMLLDNSSTMYSVSANRLKVQVEEVVDVDINDIGICSSPLSIGCQSCLTAERARQLAAEYCESVDGALPSANHQSMFNCSCIRHFKIESDTKEVEIKTGGVKTAKKKSSSSSSEESSDNMDAEVKTVKKAPKKPKNCVAAW